MVQRGWTGITVDSDPLALSGGGVAWPLASLRLLLLAVSVSAEPFSQSLTHACDTWHTHTPNILFRTPDTSLSKYYLSKRVKLLRLRLSDVQKSGQTLLGALMGQKDEKRETTGDTFHRICHASAVENTSLFPRANWLQQHSAQRQ